MVCSRVFPFLAIALCLVVCVLATADYAAKSKKVRKDAQVVIDEVLNKAKGDIATAREILVNADKMKGNAESVEAKVKEAAKANGEFQEIATKASDALKKLNAEYDKAVNEGNKLISHRKEQLKNAERMERTVGLSWLVPISDESAYLSLKENADNEKRDAQTLKQTMENESEFIKNVTSSQDKMKKLENETILAERLVDAILDAAKIDSLLKSAEKDVSQIEDKKNELSVTMGEFDKLKENTSKQLTQNFGVMYQSAENSFSAVSRQSEKAKNTAKEMKDIKVSINGELSKAKQETELETKWTNVNSAKTLFREFEAKVGELKKALESVTTHAEDAKQNKLVALNEIEKNKAKHDVEVATKTVTPTENEMPHIPSTESAENSLKIETMPTTTEHSEQEGHGSSEQLINKDSHNSITKTTGEPKHEHAVQPKVEVPNRSQSDKSDGEQVATSIPPKKIKPQQSVADTVKQHAQGGTKDKVIDRTVLAGNLLGHGAQLGDTAVTMSVSLVLALIACAAMH